MTLWLLSVPGATRGPGAAASTGPAIPAPGSIVTLAGGWHGDGLPGPEASVHPRGLAIGPDGLLYISDNGLGRVRRVAADGTVQPVAGGLSYGFAGDGGDARGALLDRPMGIDFDEQGNLYLADYGNQRVRKVTPGGSISTIAGTGRRAFGGDGGPAPAADLSGPRDVAVDRVGNVYVADSENGRVRRVDATTGVIETYAGGGLLPYRDGAKANEVSLGAQALAIGPDDDLYVASGCSIRRIDVETRTTSTVVGGGCGFEGDGGPAVAAKLGGGGNFPGPMGLDVTADGRVWIADSDNYVVRVVGTEGVIRTVAGNHDRYGRLGDGGPANEATLQYPVATALDAAGNLFVATESVVNSVPATADGEKHDRVRVVRPDGTIATYAGNGIWNATPAQGRPGIGAGFGSVNGLAWDAHGSLYIAASVYPRGSCSLCVGENGSLWRLDPDGRMYKVAGDGTMESLEGPDQAGGALSVPVYPEGLDIGPDGRVYFADSRSWQIKVYDPVTERVEILAGKKVTAASADPVPPSQPAGEAELINPLDVSVAPDGTVYFTEADGARDKASEMSRVRAIRGASVELVAGLASGWDAAGFNGDDLPATQTMLQGAAGIEALPDGDLLITELGNARVRRYDRSSGRITTVAGDGAQESRLGTIGELSSLSYPRDVALDGEGGFFVADGERGALSTRPYAAHIVHVAASGMTSPVAGTGAPGLGLDGPATSTPLYDPAVLAVGPAGIAFGDGNRVRLVTPPTGGWGQPARSVTCLPNATDPSGDSHGTLVAVDAANNPSYDVLGTEVRTIGSDLEVTIELDDLDPATMWIPGDDEGMTPAWAYQIWTGLPRGADRVAGTRIVYLGAFAAASLDDPAGASPGGFVFEAGERTGGGSGVDAQEGRETSMTVRRLGPATGSVDLEKDTITIRAPLATLGLALGDHTFRQYGVAGQITQARTTSNFRYFSFFDATSIGSRYRTVVFGRNCPGAWS